MEDDLICPACNQQYSEIKEPRMLTCGHTICLSCLEVVLMQDKPKCPQDKENLAFSQVEYFPKNYCLLKLVRKYGNKVSKSQGNVPSTHQSTTSSNASSKKFQEEDICMEHQKDLDIVCITDNKLICSFCSIFSKHKDHQVKSFRDVMQEVAIKVDIIIEMYQMVESSVFQKQDYQNIEEKINTYYQDIQRVIQSEFDQLSQLLIKAKERATQTLQRNFEQLKIQIQKEIPSDLREQVAD